MMASNEERPPELWKEKLNRALDRLRKVPTTVNQGAAEYMTNEDIQDKVAAKHEDRNAHEIANTEELKDEKTRPTHKIHKPKASRYIARASVSTNRGDVPQCCPVKSETCAMEESLTMPDIHLLTLEDKESNCQSTPPYTEAPEKRNFQQCARSPTTLVESNAAGMCGVARQSASTRSTQISRRLVTPYTSVVSASDDLQIKVDSPPKYLASAKQSKQSEEFRPHDVLKGKSKVFEHSRSGEDLEQSDVSESDLPKSSTEMSTPYETKEVSEQSIFLKYDEVLGQRVSEPDQISLTGHIMGSDIVLGQGMVSGAGEDMELSEIIDETDVLDSGKFSVGEILRSKKALKSGVKSVQGGVFESLESPESGEILGEYLVAETHLWDEALGLGEMPGSNTAQESNVDENSSETPVLETTQSLYEGLELDASVQQEQDHEYQVAQTLYVTPQSSESTSSHMYSNNAQSSRTVSSPSSSLLPVWQIPITVPYHRRTTPAGLWHTLQSVRDVESLTYFGPQESNASNAIYRSTMDSEEYFVRELTNVPSLSNSYVPSRESATESNIASTASSATRAQSISNLSRDHDLLPITSLQDILSVPTFYIPGLAGTFSIELMHNSDIMHSISSFVIRDVSVGSPYVRFHLVPPPPSNVHVEFGPPVGSVEIPIPPDRRRTQWQMHCYFSREDLILDSIFFVADKICWADTHEIEACLRNRRRNPRSRYETLSRFVEASSHIGVRVIPDFYEGEDGNKYLEVVFIEGHTFTLAPDSFMYSSNFLD